ncbi:DUF3489 domain-containing protein [Magnetofaba australis]|uniref:DUF6900 domain-containing protein n=1 Tax=Magnetofaba australis IT-1 TaxID=1434232 RepID=A0A1Y2K9N6_9PROT|nr:DUF3489 domain-containing protein [Magnetofaba australis]OSM07671.1 hypothetical protein MAIT1_04566 [Magnetofaba australis IT-1]
MSNLTNTQQTILEAAATRPDGAIYPMPDRIKGGAALKVIKALADKGLIQDAGDNDWRIAAEGFKAIGQEPPIQDDDFGADVAAAEESLQIEPPADGEPSTEPDPLMALFEQIALDHLFIDTLETRKSDSLDFHSVSVWGVKSALEAAYQAGQKAGNKATRKTGGRANSKQARMIEMMKRPEGATIEQIAQETGWNPNTVRGAIAGTLKKRLGLNVTTERLRYVGPEAKGGYTTYRIEE